jgi:hypothetical protein
VRGGARSLVVAAALAAGIAAAPSAGLAQGSWLILFIEIGGSNPNPVRPAAPVNTLQDLSSALAHCWNPPPVDREFGPVDVTFNVSFKRSGELFGKPKVVTFVQKVTPEIRGRYYTAVAEALDLCSKVPFTESMGGAVAGRVFKINMIDRRSSKRADASWPTATTN